MTVAVWLLPTLPVLAYAAGNLASVAVDRWTFTHSPYARVTSRRP